jgi:hypothetical protein
LNSWTQIGRQPQEKGKGSKLLSLEFVIAMDLYCGLRGEEIIKLDLGGLIKYLELGRNHATCPHLIGLCWAG